MKNRLMSYFVVLCICLSLYPTSVVSAAYDESSYKLTGNQINDIVGIASTQVEYHEGNSINDLSGTNQSGTNNYTKYAKDIGMGQGVAWCATFISWCARKANIPTSVIQSSTYAEASSYGVTYYEWSDYKNGAFTPKKGDLIFFNWKSAAQLSRAEHVGLISENPSANGNYVVIKSYEGNTKKNKVEYKNRTVSKNNGYFEGGYIIGFGRPNYTGNITESLNISLTSYPTTIKVGSSFGLRGSVTSGYSIKKVQGYIYRGSEVVQSSTDTPNSTSMNIQTANLNNKLKFGELSAGSYSLVVTAVDASGAAKKITKNFTVVSQPTKTTSTLAIILDKYPVSISEGSSYGLRGSVKSNYNISLVKGYIINSNGSTVQSSTDKPNSESMDIQYANLNNNLRFGKLSAGNYTMKIEAYDTSGRVVTASKSFTVKGLLTPELGGAIGAVGATTNLSGQTSNLSINMTSYPSSINQGSSFGLRGSITSDKNISQVNGYVISSSGNTVLSSVDYPNAQSMDVRYANLNNNLKFGTLAAGTYTLKITARDSVTTKAWSTSFTVVGSAANTRVGIINIPSGWSNLSIRKGPGTGYDIIGSMNQGERCTVYPDKASNGWYWVEYNGICGYASGKQINLQ